MKDLEELENDEGPTENQEERELPPMIEEQPVKFELEERSAPTREEIEEQRQLAQPYYSKKNLKEKKVVIAN
jgi:hypothetical protein